MAKAKITNRCQKKEARKMHLVELAKVDQIQEGGMAAFTVDGQEILLAKYHGRYYAIKGKCPHQGGNLSRGELNGKIITCPVHGRKIDITTGKHVSSIHMPCINNSADKHNSYEVVVEGDIVKVKLGEFNNRLP